ncbi:MAG: hypothetical protein LBU04_03370 [Christensenellaceae bacterium]|nr:hypothetical protein [Christensenellaceae bacterium]
MEIRKTNMEIRKNWNKFTFKKLGIIFCLFLFSIVTFISGNLTQVNATSSSTVLPVAKGGTGANSASGARTNLNVQEKLVSGTNIKSVLGQSLLGSGNVSDIVGMNITSLQTGQATYLSFGYAIKSVTINGHFKVVLTHDQGGFAAWGIYFNMDVWQNAYCFVIAYDTSASLQTEFATSTNKDNVFFHSGYKSYHNCKIQTRGGVFLANISYDDITGANGIVQRIA